MRINFKTSSVPTRAAKRLKSILSIKESTAREWAAQVFGYRNWHELQQSLGQGHPSALDEECNAEVGRERHRYQSERLRACMANWNEAIQAGTPESIVEAWRPTSKLPHSPLKGLFDEVSVARIAGRALWGRDPLRLLSSLTPSLLASMPTQGTPWLGREACSVARKLMRTGDDTERAFARKILEELHLCHSPAGTLHLAVSLTLGQGGPADRTRADSLFESLLDSPSTPYPIRVLALDGRAALAGIGVGWPEDLPRALTTWEAQALEGDNGAAYRLALAYDPFKPFTRDAPADPGKAVQFYRIAAEGHHREAACSLGLLLTSEPELAKSATEGEDWIEAAARQGDPLAQELLDTVKTAAARFDTLPEKEGNSFLRSLLETHVPEAERGDPVIVPELGEMVFIPPTCWIQMSTGALFAREGETFTSIADGALAPSIVSSYPRGPDKQLDRAGWVLSTGETLNRFLPYIRRPINQARQ